LVFGVDHAADYELYLCPGGTVTDAVKYSAWRAGAYGGRIRTVLGPYECGEHFCELCGDCLACYGEICYDGQMGYALQYDEDPEGES